MHSRAGSDLMKGVRTSMTLKILTPPPKEVSDYLLICTGLAVLASVKALGWSVAFAGVFRNGEQQHHHHPAALLP